MSFDDRLIRLSKSSITESDIQSVSNCLSQEYLGTGSFVEQFELSLSSLGFLNPVATSSGTSALQIALQAHGIGPGDEVILPSLTYVATFQAVTATGAVPVACDVRISDLTLCPDSLTSLISPKTKAVIHVHYAGVFGSLTSIREILDNKPIVLIEDAAHSFGHWSAIDHNYETICFSFDGIKNITCGEGGAICTRFPHIASLASDIRLLGVCNDSSQRYKNSRSWDFDVNTQGWRYHMSNINASLGLSQIKRLPLIQSTRQSLSNYYHSLLSPLHFCNPILPFLHLSSSVIPHIYPVLIDSPDFNQDEFRRFMLSRNIQVGVHYKPNHLLSFFSSSSRLPLPITIDIYPRIISLPLHLDLTYSDIDRVVTVMLSYLDS